jgi:hypothetical protein
VTTKLSSKHYAVRKRDADIGYQVLCGTVNKKLFVVSTETSHILFMLTLNVDKTEKSHVGNTCLFSLEDVSGIIWWN